MPSGSSWLGSGSVLGVVGGSSSGLSVKMAPPGLWELAAWLAVCLVTSGTAERTVYGKLGGEVDLHPDGLSVTSSTTSITWKYGRDIAVQWDGRTVDKYRQFKERGVLNTSTGALTISGLVQNDSNVYTPEIGQNVGAAVRLAVISSVPVPSVGVSKLQDGTVQLSCDGDATGAGPVSYAWRSDGNEMPNVTEKLFIVTEALGSQVREFGCEMKNPVSQESSRSVPNPTTTVSGRSLRVWSGVTVFVCLLAGVLLLVALHRLKTGVCFYNKASMPWEGDFWRKSDGQQTDISKGSSTLQPKEQPDEETPMTN
ncbi:lymphocyte function-associated antigen 3 [Nematolebias whitei]|uniref:lymphocyte function-associated antigen 3 n=1 Tax=Nematolebias whitei TaxID=451745 RepID=UPI001898ADAA|nr:lymphocyte function-associated antigen 3 [Nematolebias whitei]